MGQNINQKGDERNQGTKIVYKIFRTFGFGLLLIGSAILAVTMIIILREALGSTADSFEGYVTIMKDYLNKIGIPNLVFYAQLMVMLGSLILVMSVGRNWFLKTFFIIVFIFMSAYLIYQPEHSVLFYPVVGNVPAGITKVVEPGLKYFNEFDTLIKNYPRLMGGIITALYVIVLSSALYRKRPKRFSVGLIRASLGLITFMTIVSGILIPIAATHIEFIEGFTTSNVYFIGVYVPIAISLVLQTIGSLIGTIFFFVK